jgi:S1-C subfamily serine protease
MVELNEGLGRYFGTDSGLLVISAPGNNDLEIEDGDVIKSIDDREPQSVGHAMRILGSYQAGEELELEIMRDKRRRTLKIRMPEDDRRSFFPAPVPPAAAPAPAPVPSVPPNSG